MLTTASKRATLGRRQEPAQVPYAEPEGGVEPVLRSGRAIYVGGGKDWWGTTASSSVSQGNSTSQTGVLPAAFRDAYRVAQMGGPVSSFQRFTEGEVGATLMLPWVPELARQCVSRATQGYPFVDAWKQVPVAAIEMWLHAIKTTVLDLAINIERKNLDARECPVGQQLISKAEMTSAIWPTAAPTLPRPPVGTGMGLAESCWLWDSCRPSGLWRWGLRGPHADAP
ncbi:hypothetical protein [Cupriavidus basilensis]|uniref:AbiTii domain-containing protein n=1 Tax=Cupriavidus basilensis TaxID=68895 RepID=UPI0039F70973